MEVRVAEPRPTLYKSGFLQTFRTHHRLLEDRAGAGADACAGCGDQANGQGAYTDLSRSAS